MLVFLPCLLPAYGLAASSDKPASSPLEQAAHAVVLILSTTVDYHLIKYSEAANGIIISPDGYILTVSHGLTGGLPEVYVGDDRFPAKVVYNDTKFDFAIIKISTPYPLPFVHFARDNTLNQRVHLIGKRKRNREVFMSKGILNVKGINMSSKEISWVKTHIREKQKVDYAIQNGILHSAHFFVGLSGCPLLNDQGEVIGINTGLIGKESQRITLALELVCFLPIIQQITRADKCTLETAPCGSDIDLKNPSERITWIMNGLYHYCTLLGKDEKKLAALRNDIEYRARQKITADNFAAKEAIQWAWKSFLTESYKMQ